VFTSDFKHVKRGLATNSFLCAGLCWLCYELIEDRKVLEEYKTSVCTPDGNEIGRFYKLSRWATRPK